MATEALTNVLTNPDTLHNFGDQQLSALLDLAQSLAQTARSPSTHSPFPILPHAIQASSPNNPIQTDNHVPEPRVNNHPLPPLPNLPNPTPQQSTHFYNLRPKPHRLTNAVLQTNPTALANAIYNPESGSMLEYRQLLKKDPQTWHLSMANEIGRLAQGIGNRINGTNTIQFIQKVNIPKDKKVTYAHVIADYRSLKSEPFQTQLTIGGNLLHCNETTKTDCATLPTIKTLFNSIMSTPGCWFATGNIKNSTLKATP